MLFSQLLIACAPATVAAPPVAPPVPAPLQIDDEERVPGVNYRAPKTQLPYELPVDEPLESGETPGSLPQALHDDPVETRRLVELVAELCRSPRS